MRMSDIKTAAPRLASMMNARDRTMLAIDNIDAQIRRAAEAETRAEAALPPSFGRHATNWTQVHERHYRSLVSAIATRRANETGALRAKLMRQCDAIRAEIVRSHRIKPTRRPYESDGGLQRPKIRP